MSNTSRLQLIIEDMIELERESPDYGKLDLIKELIEEISTTYNAPSNWTQIGEELSRIYKNDDTVYNQLELYEYEN